MNPKDADRHGSARRWRSDRLAGGGPPGDGRAFLADDPVPSTEGRAARAADPELATELTAPENAAYGRGPSPGRPWSPGQLRQRARVARSRLGHRTTAEPVVSGVLPPLNPGE